jgi:sarcosine oxidase subunit beta
MGSALAYHLTRAGGREVLLYDEAYPTAGASGKGAGILCAQCWDPWDVRVVEETRDEYRELSGRHHLGGYLTTGGLRSVSSRSHLPLLEERHRMLERLRVPVRWMEPEEMVEAVPGLRVTDLLGGLLTPEDAVVEPPEMNFLYAELAQRSGAELTWGWGFRGLRREGGHWRLSTLGGEFEAAEVVLAAGAHTKRIAGELGCPLPLAPYRTQACRLLPEVEPGVFPSYHDTELDVYVRPAPGGGLVAGDGTELTESDPLRYNPGADFRFLAHVAEVFSHRLPGWAGSSVRRAWAGLCVSTPDRHPLVGPLEPAEGLYVACGFNGFGVMRAGGIARRMALALRTGNWEPLAPCAPSRFPGDIGAFSPRPGFTLEG